MSECYQPMNLQEAEQMLSIVNAAISEYVTGKRRTSLKIGTHEFMRNYTYAEITWSELIAERGRLMELIRALSPMECTPVFRKNTHFPLIVTKNPV
jgi:hypothetical protein